jgi:hypothetical protein
MALKQFILALAVAITMMIFAVSVITDNPNKGNLVHFIATIVLGCASIPILLGTIHPLLAIFLVGFIGFAVAIIVQSLIRLKGWLSALAAFSLVILIVLNTLGFVIWSTGHVEGYF